MVGSAVVRGLQAEGFDRILTRTRAELDLTSQEAVRAFFRAEKIDVVILAAAQVGGIHANSTYPAEFIYRNLMIQANVVHAAWEAGVTRLLCLGSSCIYPRHAPQPMAEESLMAGYLEPTNAPYALAKIAGIVLCASYNRQYGTRFRALMPTNLYGPNDNFDLEKSHVLPALIRKFHLAKLALAGDRDGIARDVARFGPLPAAAAGQLERQPDTVTLWGTGSARREFLHVDDLAAGCLFVMRLSDEQYAALCRGRPEYRERLPEGVPEAVHHINIGSGSDLTIRELAERVKAAVGFAGRLAWDAGRPDGTPRKLLDVSRIRESGWTPTLDLDRGLAETYRWYRQQAAPSG
jgi:GDP-L-fucose synthase